MLEQFLDERPGTMVSTSMKFFKEVSMVIRFTFFPVKKKNRDFCGLGGQLDSRREEDQCGLCPWTVPGIPDVSPNPFEPWHSTVQPH